MGNADHAKEAAYAHSDLNVFGAVVALMEGGTLYTSGGHQAASKIIRLCQTEMQRQLRAYDKALERIIP